MKVITKYVADDGSEWLDPVKAAKRDVLTLQCSLAISPLGEEPKGLDAWKFKQHSKEDFERAKSNILKIIRAEKDFPSLIGVKDEDVYSGAGGGLHMVLDGDDPICNAWKRFSCISMKTYREYNQPYYACNEDRAPLEDPDYDPSIDSHGTQH